MTPSKNNNGNFRRETDKAIVRIDENLKAIKESQDKLSKYIEEFQQNKYKWDDNAKAIDEVEIKVNNNYNENRKYFRRVLVATGIIMTIILGSIQILTTCSGGI